MLGTFMYQEGREEEENVIKASMSPVSHPSLQLPLPICTPSPCMATSSATTSNNSHAHSLREKGKEKERKEEEDLYFAFLFSIYVITSYACFWFFPSNNTICLYYLYTCILCLFILGGCVVHSYSLESLRRKVANKKERGKGKREKKKYLMVCEIMWHLISCLCLCAPLCVRRGRGRKEEEGEYK